jgi:hypothetical protein
MARVSPKSRTVPVAWAQQALLSIIGPAMSARACIYDGVGGAPARPHEVPKEMNYVRGMNSTMVRECRVLHSKVSG